MARPDEYPTVSVVIPTRGRPDLLQQALATVAAQDYSGVVESLVIFDRTELDAGLSRAHPTRPVRVLANDRTAGPAGGRNTGVLAARGELVAFLDDDDLWSPTKLSRQVAALAATGRRVVATTITVDQAGRLTERTLPSTELTFPDLLRSRTQTVHQSTILADRRHFVDVVGLFDEQVPGSYGEDFDWLLRAAKIEPVYVVPAALTRVRWHDTSWFFDRWQLIIDALTYLTDKHPALWSDRRGAAVLMGRLAFAHAALGQRAAALRWAVRTLSTSYREPRWLLTLPVVASPRAALPLLQLIRRVSGRSV